jgi:hypothetical protein
MSNAAATIYKPHTCTIDSNAIGTMRRFNVGASGNLKSFHGETPGYPVAVEADDWTGTFSIEAADPEGIDALNINDSGAIACSFRDAQTPGTAKAFTHPSGGSCVVGSVDVAIGQDEPSSSCSGALLGGSSGELPFVFGAT